MIDSPGPARQCGARDTHREQPRLTSEVPDGMTVMISYYSQSHLTQVNSSS